MSLIEQVESFFKNVPLKAKGHIAVALSGGADSLCLTLLLKDWSEKHGYQVTALTVDHGIRPESEKEAQDVAICMNRFGIRHVILKSDRLLTGSRVEERARAMRYELLLRYCHQNNIDILCVAHHLEDQAETFLSRLARGSGVDGLSAMSPILKREGILILRPLLNVSKDQIVSYLNRRNVSWVEDPMNQDLAFERVRWRQRLKLFSENELSIRSLGLSAKRLFRVREALTFFTDDFIRRFVLFHEMGFCFIPLQPWQEYPLEIQLRVLQNLKTIIIGEMHFDSLSKLEENLCFKKDFMWGKCHIIQTKKGVFVMRERRLLPSPVLLIPNQSVSWNGFLVKSTVSVQISASSPVERLSDVPISIQRFFPHFKKTSPLKKVFIVLLSERYSFPTLISGMKLFDDEKIIQSVVFFPKKYIEENKINTKESVFEILKKVLAKTPNLDYNDENTDMIYIQSDLIRIDLCK